MATKKGNEPVEQAAFDALEKALQIDFDDTAKPKAASQPASNYARSGEGRPARAMNAESASEARPDFARELGIGVLEGGHDVVDADARRVGDGMSQVGQRGHQQCAPHRGEQPDPAVIDAGPHSLGHRRVQGAGPEFDRGLPQRRR